jgi:hypothetical protein
MTKEITMFWSTLVSLLKTILYGWIISLWQFLKTLKQPRPTPPRGTAHRPPAPSNCVPIDHPAFVRPDPLLYAQRYLRAQGIAVTWDNPDIILFKAGVPVDSSDLEPSTTYDVQARIWNNSTEAPVIAMPVHLAYLDFGVSTEPIPIGSGTVDVGVKGSLGQPGFVTIPWTTPATPGHYCLQVQLDPVDDLNPANNLGQENTNVRAAASPAVFTFTLRNNTGRLRRYHFEVDAYQIPGLPNCEDKKPDSPPPLDPHRPERHPVPAGFTVQINPPTPALDPGAQIPITVTVDPPIGFLGRQTINVNAFHEDGFAGGVTLTTVQETL